MVHEWKEEAKRECHVILLQVSKGRGPEWAEFSTTFDEEVTEIVASAIKFARLLKERIITADYIPFNPSEFTKGRYDPSKMEVADKDSAPPPRTPVMCTLRLGLTSRSKVGRERDAPLQEYSFRKAEVMTSHCLDYIIEEEKANAKAKEREQEQAEDDDDDDDDMWVYLHLQ